MSYTISFPEHPEFLVQHTGMLFGKTAYIIDIFGYRNQWNSNTVMGDVCAYLTGGQDKMNTPSVGTTYYVRSTSAQDTTGGTGVDRARITYLDSLGNEQVVVVDLNGTTAVSIGTGFTFIQYMETYHSVNVDVVAVGAITISSINGVATEATTMEMVLAGSNRSQSLRYKVPTGYVAHLINYDIESTVGGVGASTKLRTTQLIQNGLSTSYTFLDIANLATGATHSTNLYYHEIPAGGIVKLSCIPGQIASGNRLTASLHMIIQAV